MSDKEYTPYGPEWEKEMMKLTKKQLIDLISKLARGTLSE